MFSRLIDVYIEDDIDFRGRSYHKAFLLRGKRTVFQAENLYDRQCFNGKATTSMHAEINCVRQLKSFKSVKKFRLLVININKGDGSLKNSLPCGNCRNYLLSKGFTSIYCSTDEGDIKKFKLEDIKHTETVSQKKFYKYGYEKW